MILGIEEAVDSDSPGFVVFPGAGSFGNESRSLLRALEPSAWLVRYPGRFGKDFGTAAGSFEKLVQSCVNQVRHREPNQPVLIGHSFGAYVAYATASALADLGAAISALVVVGASAPSLMSVPESADRNRSDIAAFLDSIDTGLLPDESSSEWRDIIIDTAMQDLRLLREFDASEYRKVCCPVIATCGATDPLTSFSELGAWAEITADACAYRVFPGGHSELLRSPEFSSWLRETVNYFLVNSAAPSK